MMPIFIKKNEHTPLKELDLLEQIFFSNSTKKKHNLYSVEYDTNILENIQQH